MKKSGLGESITEVFLGEGSLLLLSNDSTTSSCLPQQSLKVIKWCLKPADCGFDTVRITRACHPGPAQVQQREMKFHQEVIIAYGINIANT